MKKFFSRFIKEERGVVMMEYVVLGVFTVAVTVVAAMTLGIAYTGSLNTMSLATVGETTAAADYQNSMASNVGGTWIPSANAYIATIDVQKNDAVVLPAPQIYR